MLGFDLRAARAAWTVFLVALALIAVYYVRRILLIFVLSILFAYLLSPIVNLVNRFLPGKRSRTFSLAAVYCVFIGLLVLLGVLVGNTVAREASNLATGLPEFVKNLEDRLQSPGPPLLAPAKRFALDRIQEHAQSFSTVAIPLIQQASAHLLGLLGNAVTIILIPIFGFFFLKDGEELKGSVLAMVSPEHRAVWEDIFGDVHILLGQFIRALALLGAATFCVYSAFFTIAGVAYGVLLAAIAGALEVIPWFGPLTAAAIVILVAAFTGYNHIVLLLIFLGAYRVFQDYILSPRLMGSQMALHPLLMIFCALAGGELGGIPGMFLSVPILAILRVIYVRIRKSRAAPSPLLSES
ncbi:MAG: AI-2E family transporter [Bryobacteraceae bacterium]